MGQRMHLKTVTLDFPPFFGLYSTMHRKRRTAGNKSKIVLS